MNIKSILKRVLIFTITVCLSITTIGVVPTFSDDTTQYGYYELKVTKVNITEDNGDLSESEKVQYSTVLKDAFEQLTLDVNRPGLVDCLIDTRVFTFQGREMFISAEMYASVRKNDGKVEKRTIDVWSHDNNGMPKTFHYKYNLNEEVISFWIYIAAKDGSFRQAVIITLDTEIVKFTPYEYSLVYDPDEGYGTMKSTSVFIDDYFTFPECTFEKPDNKTFDHWKMSGVDGIFKAGDKVKIAYNCAQEGRIVVTAHWKEAPGATIKKDAVAKDLKYNGKAQDLVTAGVAENGKMQYVLSKDNATAPRLGWSDSISKKTEVGTYYVWYRATGDAEHSNSKAKCCTVTIKDGPVIKDNTLSIKAKKVKVKYKKLRKKAQRIIAKKSIKYIDKGQGKLTYKLVKVKKAKFKKYFKINKKTGKLTIKKRLKKGTYKVIIKIKAAGNEDYKVSAWKKVTVKVKVK